MGAKFDFVFESLSPLLEYKNCTFAYQRKNCKKHGHLKKKVNRISGETTYEIRIEKNDLDAALIYTFIHELTHHINDHLDNNNLFYWQQELVADYVALHFINQFGLYRELENSNLAKKWNINTYSDNYSRGKKTTNKKNEIMQIQQKTTIMKIDRLIYNNIRT